ncbi:dTDP-4-dehydrorhamnose reductase [Aquimarina sp. AD1]|nr:dTDP-4-dehydrorhamnose reductase [Aquimarina sp. AD1]AXT58738.1 dTDP-4-dehydrorhamnose reductase [Aquimarina sp. AD1]RKN03727.1 dTDP-4-dehydrorhamnose reductase [Aquimarina sp. AD1]
MRVLVTGGDGQLGKCIKALEMGHPTIDFRFASSKVLDITNKKNIAEFFKNNSLDYVVNCAAYTNVEQAEKEPDKAYLVNAEGVKNLAEICKKYDATLIHISTDYVFDGHKNTPYTEEDVPNPINEYGKSKLAGEQYIEEILKSYFIIRTSWLYSQYGKNFYKAIREKCKTEKKLAITTSEVGTPTNANDLGYFLLQIIEIKSKKFGVYHFSNSGSATWYDFAREIVKRLGKLETIKLEKIDNYPTFAKRPGYSVLSKEKSLNSFDLNLLNWKESLKKLMIEINEYFIPFKISSNFKRKNVGRE